MSNIIKITTFCRLCQSKKLHKFLKLGKIPITNQLSKKNKKLEYPSLNIVVCKNCWHVQSGCVPNSSNFYRDNYTYHTRFIKTINDHFFKNAKKITKKFKLKKNDLVIDIGGNDGTYLKHFKKINKNIRTLCIEPTTATSNYAKKIGLDVYQNFFNYKNSSFIKKKYGTPKIILCTNSFGNIDDIKDFTNGLANIMDDKTIFIFENPYLKETLRTNQFDTMYYEHVSYFSISPLVNFFSRFNLEMFNVEKTKVHGGSIMVYVKKKINKNKRYLKIIKIIKEEKTYGLNRLSTYLKFSNKINTIKKTLVNLVNKISKKHTIVAYGASDRGMVLLNYCKLGSKQINFVVDKNPFKHNYYYSGTGLKINDVAQLIKINPEYILLTAWNFHKEIIKYLRYKVKSKFIIPLPSVKIFK